eukprot:scaffold44955_cov76-Phaeocystis_antarctica.AAC.2
MRDHRTRRRSPRGRSAGRHCSPCSARACYARACCAIACSVLPCSLRAYSPPRAVLRAQTLPRRRAPTTKPSGRGSARGCGKARPRAERSASQTCTWGGTRTRLITSPAAREHSAAFGQASASQRQRHYWSQHSSCSDCRGAAAADRRAGGAGPPERHASLRAPLLLAAPASAAPGAPAAPGLAAPPGARPSA